jgi:DNA-binding transcriptional LysR family regulator
LAIAFCGQNHLNVLRAFHLLTGRSEREVTLHQLRIFGAVAKHLNVTKAAYEVRISQPTVSKQLRLLQDEFRAKFYLRVGQGIELTEEGRQFWQAVQPILKGIDRLRETFPGTAKETQFLIVGGTQSPSSSLIPEALQAFKLTHPDVQPILRTGNSPTLERMVLNSEVELALITKPSHNPRIAADPFYSEPIVAVVSAKHPLAKKEKLNQEELVKAPFIVRTGGTIAKRLAEIGIKLNPVITCSSAEAVKSAVQSAVGIGLFFRHSVEPGLRQGYLRSIKIPGLKEIHVRFYTISHKGTPLSAYAKHFLGLLRQARKSN